MAVFLELPIANCGQDVASVTSHEERVGRGEAARSIGGASYSPSGARRNGGVWASRAAEQRAAAAETRRKEPGRRAQAEKAREAGRALAERCSRSSGPRTSARRPRGGAAEHGGEARRRARVGTRSPSARCAPAAEQATPGHAERNQRRARSARAAKALLAMQRRDAADAEKAQAPCARARAGEGGGGRGCRSSRVPAATTSPRRDTERLPATRHDAQAREAAAARESLSESQRGGGSRFGSASLRSRPPAAGPRLHGAAGLSAGSRAQRAVGADRKQ